jgi:hypothetical protein
MLVSSNLLSPMGLNFLPPITFLVLSPILDSLYFCSKITIDYFDHVCYFIFKPPFFITAISYSSIIKPCFLKC